MSPTESKTTLIPGFGIEEIRRFLPHRYPFLLVDRVLEIEAFGDVMDPHPGPSKVGTRVKALKNVSFNEPQFQGHFPSLALMPGVLLLEMMAQVSCFSLYPYLIRMIDQVHEDFQCILIGADGARFRKPVIPGDTLIAESVVTKCREKLWSFDVRVKSEGVLVAEATVLAQIAFKKDVQ